MALRMSAQISFLCSHITTALECLLSAESIISSRFPLPHLQTHLICLVFISSPIYQGQKISRSKHHTCKHIPAESAEAVIMRGEYIKKEANLATSSTNLD